MLKLERKKVKFELDGREHELRFPTAIERQKYAIASNDEDKALEETMSFLVKLGLEKDVVESMELEHMFDVLAEFKPEEKKS